MNSSFLVTECGIPSCSGRLHQQPSPAIHHYFARIPRASHMLIHRDTTSCSASQNGTQNGLHKHRDELTSREKEAPIVWTKFVAETLLPTAQGKFRLRGYRHTVSFSRIAFDHPIPPHNFPTFPPDRRRQDVHRTFCHH